MPGGAKRLADSATKSGHAPIVLGEGEVYTCNVDKLRHVSRWLGTKAAADFTHVLFVDGYDSLMLASEAEVLAKFQAFKRPVVICAAVSCYPDRKLAESFAPTSTPWRFPCAGAWLGERDAVIDLVMSALELAPPNPKNPRQGSDQGLIQQVMLAKPDMVAIDGQCELFQVTTLSRPLNFAGGRITNTVTGAQPCVIHGSQGFLLEQAERQLAR